MHVFNLFISGYKKIDLKKYILLSDDKETLINLPKFKICFISYAFYIYIFYALKNITWPHLQI